VRGPPLYPTYCSFFILSKSLDVVILFLIILDSFLNPKSFHLRHSFSLFSLAELLAFILPMFCGQGRFSIYRHPLLSVKPAPPPGLAPLTLARPQFVLTFTLRLFPSCNAKVDAPVSDLCKVIVIASKSSFISRALCR